MSNCTVISGGAGDVPAKDPEDNLLLAFLLTTAAGLCTTIGALAGFVSTLRDKRLLSIGLALSAGVMLFVSVAEILAIKAVESFETKYGEHASLYAYLCFFAGIGVNTFIDWVVHRLSGDHQHHPQPGDHMFSPRASPDTSTDDTALNSGVALVPVDRDTTAGLESPPSPSSASVEAAALQKTGLIAALAIGIHNLPEGLASFITVLDDPQLGLPIVFAIALHNVPEGVVVALPIFYATGSAWKAFGYAFLSGISEPIGAAMGYFFLRAIFDDTVYGVLFGLVSGMMVYISVKELLPTARLYDPADKYVTTSTVVGMFIMAASLVLFKL